MRQAETYTDIRTRNPLSGKPVKVRRSGLHKGSIGKLNSFTADELYADTDSIFGGRWKAKRDAKAAKKVRKANAPSRKELKASKVKSKNILRRRKGESKLIKAGAKQTKAEKGGGGKVADTLNKAFEVGAELLNKNKGSEEGEEAASRASAPEEQKEKTFLQKYGAIIAILSVVIILAIIFFATRKK